MGSLPASTEIVLEIQLNKLIRDFLFSGAGDGDVNCVWNSSTEGKIANSIAEMDACHGEAKPWIIDNLPAERICGSCDAGSTATSAMACCGLSMHTVSGFNDDQNRSVGLSHGLSGYGSTTSTLPSNNSPCSPTGKVHDEMLNVCVSQHTKILELFCLSKSQSMVRSMFCFPMRKYGENREKNGKFGDLGSNIKLSRIGSSPCHSQLCNESDESSKYTCQKPPRPPKSPLEKSSNPRYASADGVLVLHGTPKHARLERRKPRAGVLSSNAFMCALIFTLFFVLATLEEGFWSQNTALTTSNSSRSLNSHGTMPDNKIILNSEIVSMEKTAEHGPYFSSRLEKSLHLNKSWMWRGLVPS